ncbi:MAG: hypothetical protein ACI8PG_000057 [Planctomycetota bacterium]
MHRSIALFCSLLTLVVLSAFSAEAQEQVETDSLAFESKHYPALQVPQLLWNGLVYPLGQFTIYSEHTRLPQRVNNWFTNEAQTFGLLPQVQLGGETGSGGGLRSFHSDLFGAGVQAEALYVYAGGRGQTGQALLSDEEVAGGKLYWLSQFEWLKTRNQSATINGGWRESKIRRLAVEQLDARFSLGLRLHDYTLEQFVSNTVVEGRVSFGRRDLTQRSGVGDWPFPTPGYTVEADRLLGLGADISLFSVGALLAYDDRDSSEPTTELSHPINYVLPGRILHKEGDLYHQFRDIYYPERGGLLQVEADLVSGDKEVRFVRLGAEVQRFFTLFWRHRILALRARLDKVSALGSESIVPYTELPTLGGSQRLRGYRRGDFRGEGALLLSAEYRWPIWDSWSAYLFLDEGQVFDEFGEIEAGELHSSWGGGINIRTAEAYLIGLRIGHSSAENALIGFTLEQEF